MYCEQLRLFDVHTPSYTSNIRSPVPFEVTSMA